MKLDIKGREDVKDLLHKAYVVGVKFGAGKLIGKNRDKKLKDIDEELRNI